MTGQMVVLFTGLGWGKKTKQNKTDWGSCKKVTDELYFTDVELEISVEYPSGKVQQEAGYTPKFKRKMCMVVYIW